MSFVITGDFLILYYKVLIKKNVVVVKNHYGNTNYTNQYGAVMVIVIVW